MNPSPSYTNPEFDQFADNYDQALQQGLAVSGERKEFFAQGRVDWLARRLHALQFSPSRVLDFGCGTGTAAPLLLALPGAKSVLGVEVSSKSLAVARRLHGSAQIEFKLCSEYDPGGDIDLAFCSGVFHHVPLAERTAAVAYILKALRPGGLFAFCENNPWNPGTRLIMSRIPFDRDAIPLSPPTAHRLLNEGGFELLGTDFLFFFPAALRRLRFVEPGLVKLPLGAQYQILARRPGGP